MRRRVQKWGNSLALRIPNAFASEVGLSRNAEVELRVAEGEIRISPVPPEELSLDALIRQISPENLHEEIFVEDPEGREAW